LPTISIISYAIFAVLLFYCVKWFVQGLKGTHKPPPEPTVKVKAWLLGRTIIAWFLVLLFCSMAISGQQMRLRNPPESEDSSYAIGQAIGTLSVLAGIGLSLSWARKLNREWRQRRRDTTEKKAVAQGD
jgi:protein-S-isoprenylcysteine O-methyltransferase Ste14